MENAIEDSQPSIATLAQSGNLDAIAHWLNRLLLPHNLFTQVNATPQPHCIQVLVEFYPSPQIDATTPEFQTSLVRFICHHVWQLNSATIEGVQIVARFVGQPQILWRQAVRVISPARRARLEQINSVQHDEHIRIRSRIQQVTRQRVQFRALRSLLLTGTTAAAFIIGCWLGYADAPSEQTAAVANSPQRSNTVAAALESVPVETAKSNSTDGSATLVFTGDVALTKTYSDVVGNDRAWAFSALDQVRQADVSIVSLEAPFTTATTPQSTQSDPLKSDPANVEVLKNGGVDLVNLANDRVMDYQASGLEDTLKTLESAGIHHIGAGRNDKEARRPEILDVNGQRIAYLGYSDSDLQAAKDNTPGTNAKQNDRIAADIKAIRDQVDWVVVNFHWGAEIAKYPGDWQIGLAHFTIDQGADLVVGYHSTMLQGAELYKGRPIVYSLGNFIFGGSTQSDYDTAMLRVALKDKQMKVEMLPVEVKGFQPRVVSSDRGKEILQQVESVSDIFHTPLRSPVVIDARSNTVMPQPDSSSTKPAESSSPEPLSDPTPSPATTPEATPTTPPSASPEATPTSSPTSAQPWNDNSFISNPTPQASPSPSDAPNSGDASQRQGNSTIDPATHSTPANSLEPIKRRYAVLLPQETVAALYP